MNDEIIFLEMKGYGPSPEITSPEKNDVLDTFTLLPFLILDV